MDSTLFASGLLAQNAVQTNWMTPVWLFSTGIAIGFVMFLLLLVKIWIGRRIPGLNQIWNNPTSRIVAGTLLSLVYLSLIVGLFYWQAGAKEVQKELLVLIAVAVPIATTIGFGAWALISKRQIGETKSIVREGFLGWINWFCVGLLVFSVGGYFLSLANGLGVFKPVDDPTALVDSLIRLPYAGTTTTSYTIPPTQKGETHAIDVNFESAELKSMLYMANKKLLLTPNKNEPLGVFDLPAATEFEVMYLRREGEAGPFSSTPSVRKLEFTNLSDSEALLNLKVTTGPVYLEVLIVPVLAILTLAVLAGYLCLATMFPKIFAIAHATFKTEFSQPVYLLAFLIAFFFIVGSVYIPYNTFGEDIKMYKDSGITLLRVLAIFVAIWASSKSVASEIEGRTALTVLSKPVGRRQFILGKFSGISLTLALFFIVLGFWLMVWIAYKPLYDFRESSKGLAEWTLCFQESVHVLPGIFLCFLEVVIFVAISVAISTRMGILPNFLICFAIYVLGHLTPLLVQSSSIATIPTVSVFANLIAIVFPVLNHFDVQAAISTNETVPLVYIGWSMVYTAIYGAMAMLFALVLFEDRDLA